MIPEIAAADANRRWFGNTRETYRVDRDLSVDVVHGRADSHLRDFEMADVSDLVTIPGVPVVEAGELDGSRYVAGVRLESSSPVLDLPGWRSQLEAVWAAAETLADTHDRGVYHGALHPDAIRVLDGEVFVEEIGFGLGMSRRWDMSVDDTIDEFVPPEGPGLAGDVWALGKIILEIGGLPTTVRELAEQMASVDPGDRPTAADVADRLRDFFNDPADRDLVRGVIDRVLPRVASIAAGAVIRSLGLTGIGAAVIADQITRTTGRAVDVGISGQLEDVRRRLGVPRPVWVGLMVAVLTVWAVVDVYLSVTTIVDGDHTEAPGSPLVADNPVAPDLVEVNDLVRVVVVNSTMTPLTVEADGLLLGHAPPGGFTVVFIRDGGETLSGLLEVATFVGVDGPSTIVVTDSDVRGRELVVVGDTTPAGATAGP